jgi:hypothetical protein
MYFRYKGRIEAEVERFLRTIFGPKKQKVTGGQGKFHDFIMLILLGLLNQRGWNWQ